jgi:hypothetical protein
LSAKSRGGREWRPNEAFIGVYIDSKESSRWGKLFNRDSSRCGSPRQRRDASERRLYEIRWAKSRMGASGGPTEPTTASTTTAEEVLVGTISLVAIQAAVVAKGSEAEPAVALPVQMS